MKFLHVKKLHNLALYELFISIIDALQKDKEKKNLQMR